jgi:hypothetical protein
MRILCALECSARESSIVRAQIEVLFALELAFLETRKEVQRGWFTVSEILMAEGRKELASEVWRFAAEMLPPKTERELIAKDLRRRARDARMREGPAQTPRSH